jgi:hypothetical protein
MVNPYSQKTVKKKGFDGVEYEVPQTRTLNSVLAGMAVSGAIQDGRYDDIATGPLSTRPSAQRALEAAGYENKSKPAVSPSWVNGSSSPGLPTENRRAPITPLPGAVLLQPGEDEASADTKRPLGVADGSNRPVVDRNTGRVRTEEDEELRRGAVLLR